MDEIIRTSAGTPYPQGVAYSPDGANFAVFTDSNEEITLCLFISTSSPPDEIPIPYKTGKLRHIFIHNLDKKYKAYAFRIKYNEQIKINYLSDPYVAAIDTPKVWHEERNYNPIGLLVPSSTFDWEEDRNPEIPPNELILYEMHVRGFTQHESSGIQKKGTFLGLIEKIPYLLELGINAVELLPICEFNENEYSLLNPETNQKLCQYWGYSTVNFFAPMNRFAFSDEAGSAIWEFKTMVKEFHKHGLEVILDMVYNHTAEGNQYGPVYNFKGLANDIYYMMVGPGQYRNYSGCGNTVNCNQPVVRHFILQSLRYWVSEMHVDGFRFDLASIFYRDHAGEILAFPPILDAITEDPILANVKLIAEPWDASGLYHVGSFFSESARWSEWNGRYRDCIRKFIKGDKGLKGEFATRISGSQDLYQAKKTPCTSINYITCHDGFTLRDLVSYNEKHNFSNGEDNRDGSHQNDSWNCGIEGETEDEDILFLRAKQMRNFHLALIISQGIPLLNMGDEYGHTKRGNNNTWCQDNELNWFLWDELKKNLNFYRFYKGLIAFRKNEPLLRRKSFLKDNDIVWHGIEPHKPEWDKEDGFVAFSLIDERNGSDLYIAFNVSSHEISLLFPERNDKKSWHWIANTSWMPPSDFQEGQGTKVQTRQYLMPSYSSLLLKAF